MDMRVREWMRHPVISVRPRDSAAHARAIDRFETLTTESVRRIAAKWAGLRTFTPDRTPVVGFDPRAQGFFWLAGQGGYGMQSSSGMARIAAALASGDAIPPDIVAYGVSDAALSPDRFG